MAQFVEDASPPPPARSSWRQALVGAHHIAPHCTASHRIAAQRSASHHGARMPGVPCSRAALPGEASPPCPRLDTGLATTVGDAESYTASSEHLSLRVPRKANSSLTLFDLGPWRAVCGGWQMDVHNKDNIPCLSPRRRRQWLRRRRWNVELKKPADGDDVGDGWRDRQKITPPLPVVPASPSDLPLLADKQASWLLRRTRRRVRVQPARSPTRTRSVEGMQPHRTCTPASAASIGLLAGGGDSLSQIDWPAVPLPPVIALWRIGNCLLCCKEKGRTEGRRRRGWEPGHAGPTNARAGECGPAPYHTYGPLTSAPACHQPHQGPVACDPEFPTAIRLVTHLRTPPPPRQIHPVQSDRGPNGSTTPAQDVTAPRSMWPSAPVTWPSPPTTGHHGFRNPRARARIYPSLVAVPFASARSRSRLVPVDVHVDAGRTKSKIVATLHVRIYTDRRP
ncbi:hypothetical protein PCL_04218 [Purpureocillium lilacinum]|uniref:Uncharacterized protein n=1 Tax=Purpureocillium lilacinum TaxID=33203 RepID=A0A2U3ER96_PURLI|nr:hypothetical protein PCL_04218 [Purpureocillium lilacinum]